MRHVAALAGLLLLGIRPAVASEGVAPLALIPVVQPAVPPPADVPLRVRVETQAVPEGRVLALERYVPLADPDARDWLAPSFVIDWDEPAVVAMSKEFRTATQEPSVPAVVDFVHRSLAASGNRGFDIASQVAEHRDGDCSEHAVITAALLRASGVPARVVVGLALFQLDGRYVAYGHAWVDARVDGRWEIADAAMVGMPSRVWYVPASLLDDEGPGFVLGLAGRYSRMARSVEVLGPDAGAAPPGREP